LIVIVQRMNRLASRLQATVAFVPDTFPLPGPDGCEAAEAGCASAAITSETTTTTNPRL
jgi:hypothetical protein